MLPDCGGVLVTLLLLVSGVFSFSFWCLATVKLVQSMCLTPLLSMLFHLSSKKYFKAITPPMFIKFVLYKEKYLEFLFVIPFPIFGFWNAMVPFYCIQCMLPPLPYFKVNIWEREREREREREVFVEWMDFEKINVLGIIILLCFLINRRLLQK
jgi:hypothetical protein